MQNVIIFTLILVIAYISLYFVKAKSDDSFLGRGHTDILKGYAIFCVLFGHVTSYSGIEGLEFLSGVSVTLFIMLSGYGVYFSYMKKGLKGFWKNRLLRIFLPYFIAESIYLLVSGRKVGVLDLVLDYLLIKPIHQFGWYLTYIVVCYLIFYVTRKIFKNNRFFFISLLFMFGVWFVLRSTVFIFSTPFLQARQMLAFPVGILLAVYKEKLEGYIKKLTISIPLVLFGLLLYAFMHTSIMNIDNTPLFVYNFISLFTVTSCAVGIIGLVYRCKFLMNKGLTYASQISYELYLIHGYTIFWIQRKSVIGIITFAIVTVVLSVLLSKVVNFISSKVRKI